MSQQKLLHENHKPESVKRQNTFSVGGGGLSTISASSTLKGTSTLVESAERYLPFLPATLNI